MKKKILTVLGVILLVLLGTAAGILLNGHYFKSAGDLKPQNNNAWMRYIRDDALLIDTVMPGSHDAGTCSINYLGRTQGYSVETQLQMGARYFDLRVSKTEDGYFMYHAMFNGELFETVLDAITAFITENPTETLILDFQHFSGDSEPHVLSMLETSLVAQDLVIRNRTEKSDLAFISELQLQDARGKCVVLFGGNAELVAQYDFLFNRNNDDCTKTGQVLNSCYISEYNKMNSRDFIKTALPYYYQNIEQKLQNEGFKGFFVLQGQLTDGYLIFGPYSKEKTHDKNMTAYISRLPEDPDRLQLTNIIMRDFLTTDKCEDIIALNLHKGLIKAEHEAEFSRLYNE